MENILQKKITLLKTNIKYVAFFSNFFVLWSISLQAQNFQWAKSIGSPVFTNENVYTSCLDASGNIYIAGRFANSVDFDPGPGVFPMNGGFYGNIFIAKFDASGNFIWAKNFKGNNYTYPVNTILLDDFGNILICGSFLGTTDFDPGNGIYSLSTNSYTDNYICKLNSNGDFVWAKKLGSKISDNQISLALDDVNNIYLCSTFSDTIDIDPGIGIYNLVSNGSSDICILKLNSSGDFVWAKQLGNVGSDYGIRVCKGENGTMYFAGEFRLTVDFNPGPAINNLTASNISNFGGDMFILKLDTMGNYVWAKRIGGTSETFPTSMKLDNSNNLIVGGDFYGTADFDPNAATFLMTAPPTFQNGFIIKFNSLGNLIWANHLSSSGASWVNSIDIDASGNIFSTGYFCDTTNFDLTSTNQIKVAIGLRDIFIQQLDSASNFLWLKTFGIVSGVNQGVSILHDASTKAIIVSGDFSDTLDFNPPSANYLSHEWWADVFIVKYNINGVGIIDNPKSSDRYSINPNPTKGNVTLNLNYQNSMVEICIVNTLGELLSKKQYFNTSKLQIDLDGPSGLYFLHVKSDDGVRTLKVIKE